MATLGVEWKPGGPKLTIAVAAPSTDNAKPANTLDFDALVDTGYDLSMVPAAKASSLQLAKLRDGYSNSPFGDCETSIHRGSLWIQNDALAGNVEFSAEDREWGLLGQNVLLNPYARTERAREGRAWRGRWGW
jgi:predicted aspartyl protease